MFSSTWQQAQAVTLTVAQSFSTAQEDWEEKERKDRENQEKVYNALTEACVRAYVSTTLSHLPRRPGVAPGRH